MTSDDNSARDLPDVAHQPQSQQHAMLDWVGMDNIQVPVLVEVDGESHRVPARVDAHAGLDTHAARGIHMSRLYVLVERALTHKPISPCLIRRLLHEFVESQAGLTQRARLRVRYEHMVRRAALESDNSGWRAYPITIDATLDGQDVTMELATEVVYSSTCPASAALSRQLIRDQFARDFAPDATLDRDTILAWLNSDNGIVATPHAQRSVAKLRLRPVPSFGFDSINAIDRVEQALGTPVQTAVKREDEQAFARANGANLLFCEDAARRIRRALAADENLADFAVRVSHEESLHPHDAVAQASKGVPGGYDDATAFT